MTQQFSFVNFKNASICSPKKMKQNVYNITIHNNKQNKTKVNMNTTQMPVNCWTDESFVVHSPTGIWYNSEDDKCELHIIKQMISGTIDIVYAVRGSR